MENLVLVHHGIKGQRCRTSPEDFIAKHAKTHVSYAEASTLKHSEMYAADMTEADEFVIQHGHKYIKRIKTKLGKWRYIYKNQLSKVKKKINKKIDAKLDFHRNYKKNIHDVRPGTGKYNTTKATSRDHKYLYKIRLSNGMYRYFYSEDEYQNYKDREKYQANEPDFMKNVPEIKDGNATETDDERTQRVNPSFEEATFKWGSGEYATNCQYCTMTYELRARGYDVTAANRSNGKYKGTWDATTDYFEGAKPIKLGKASAKDIYDTAKKMGPGARGEIAVAWKGGGAHSMVFENDKNGNVRVRDTQTNATYDLRSLADTTSYVQMTRTDNLQVKPEILDCVTTAFGDGTVTYNGNNRNNAELKKVRKKYGF